TNPRGVGISRNRHIGVDTQLMRQEGIAAPAQVISLPDDLQDFRSRVQEQGAPVIDIDAFRNGFPVTGSYFRIFLEITFQVDGQRYTAVIRADNAGDMLCQEIHTLQNYGSFRALAIKRKAREEQKPDGFSDRVIKNAA